MTSLNNVETLETNENLPLDDYYSSDIVVSESEAAEFNSCLNFLSILDEDASNDSCDFTLFRKKDESNTLSNSEKEHLINREPTTKISSKNNKINNSFEKQNYGENITQKEKDNTIDIEKEIKKDIAGIKEKESKKVDDSIIKKGDIIKKVNDHCSNIRKKEKDILEVITNELIENKEQPTNQNFISSECKSQANKSPNFKVTKLPCGEVFKIHSASDKLPLSKKETSSMLRSAKVIILKVPKQSPNKSNEIPQNPDQLKLQNFVKNENKMSETNSPIKIIWQKNERNEACLPDHPSENSLAIKNVEDLKDTQKVHIKGENTKLILPDTIKVKILMPSLATNSSSEHLSENKNNIKIDDFVQVINGKKILNIQDKTKIIFKNKTALKEVTKKENDSNLMSEFTNEMDTDNTETNQGKNIEANNLCEVVKSNDLIKLSSNICQHGETSVNNNNTSPKLDNQNLKKENVHCEPDLKKLTQLEKNKLLEETEMISKSSETKNPKLVNNLKSEELLQEENQKKVNETIIFKSESDQNDKESSLKIKTRLVAGEKCGKAKKKYNKIKDMSKSQKSLQVTSKVLKNIDNTVSNDKYIPLTRTELPTFLPKLGSNDVEKSKKQTNPSAARSNSQTGALKNKSNKVNRKKLNKKDKEICKEYSLMLNDNKSSKINDSEIFESVNFPPILPKISLFEEEDLALFENENIYQQNRDVVEESSNFFNFNSFLQANLNQECNFTSNYNLLELNKSTINTNPFSSKEILLERRDMTNPNYNNPSKEFECNNLAKQGKLGCVSHSVEESTMQPTIDSSSQRKDFSPENDDLLKIDPNIDLIPSLSLICKENLNSFNENENMNEEKGMPLGEIDETYITQKSPAMAYSFNNSSPLSFTIQNILENMFRYESFPSSSNMNTLAKLLDVQWKDVRDWFAARRNLNKKNGIFPRNQVLISCAFCPEFELTPNKSAITHLLQRNHIQNMLKSMQKDYLIFSKYQNEIKSKNIGTESTQTAAFNTQQLELVRSELSISDIGNMPQGKSEQSSINSIYSSNMQEGKSQGVNAVSRTDNLFIGSEETLSEICNLYKTLDQTYFKKDKSKCKALEYFHQLKSNLYIGYRCPDCSKIFQSEWMLIKHSISHKKLICCECNEVFLREDLLHHHLKKHLIESMDDELYSMYVCFKCYSLDCICVPETHFVPPTCNKFYLRPQMAKRSKPFLSPPYSGVNEHLKVTMKEFWNKFKPSEKIHSPIKTNTPLNIPAKIRKEEVKPNLKIGASVTPTYTNMTTFNCDMCESFFFTQDELKEHITVHRIQARSREKKKGDGEKKKTNSDYEFLKPTAPLNPLYFCAYCVKGFKRESTLSKHLKLECRELPKYISEQLSSGSPFQIERAGKSRHYKVRLPSSIESSAPFKSKRIRCGTCCVELSSDEDVKHVCREKTDQEFGGSDEDVKEKKSFDLKLEPIEVKMKEKEYYFLCTFCNIPLMSEKHLHSHIQNSCSKANNKVKLKLNFYSLSELLKLGKGVYFNKVLRGALSEVISPRKLSQIMDISTFEESKTNYKKVKCKFCDNNILKINLKSHLLHHCKSMPQELRTMLLECKNRVFGSNFRAYKKLKKSSDSVPIAVTANIGLSSVAEENGCLQNEKDTQPAVKESSNQPPAETNMLYDCHLCEEKFKISKDFILHMLDFHCMKISEGACYKWLSFINTSKTDSISTNEKDRLGLPLENRNHLENMGEQDGNSESFAETLLVSDIGHLGEEIESKSPTVRSSNSEKRKDSSKLPLSSPNKSQKIDDELLGDLDNLDSFIETVQLEDSSFVAPRDS